MKTIQKTFYVFMLVCLMIVMGCSSDDNDLDQPDSGTLTTEEINRVVSAIVDIIRDSGRDFPQFEENPARPLTTYNLDDFLDGPNNYLETINEPENLKVRLWLDDEGNIIPSPTWQQNNPNYCSNEGLEMRSAKKLLEFKVMYDPDFGLTNPDQYAFGVQLNLIDVETSVINESVWTNPIIDENGNWIKATLNEAWDQMLDRATIGGAVGPCKDEISLSLHFSSEQKRKNLDPEGGWEYYDKVEGVIALSFNSATNAYEGTGSIASVDGYAIGVAGDPEYNPYQGELIVFELITPLLAEGGTDFPFLAMTMTIDNLNTYPLSWLLCHGEPNGDYGIPENGYFVVFIDEWDEVDEPGIVLRKTYDLNDFPLPGTDYGDNNITEHTVIEIHRE